jgi:hypothetical protein
MAFLHQVPLRPACIISALPKSFRDSLCQELNGSVAVSTCPPDELETAVRLRGASFAIVGATDQSVEAAEKLSHASNDVKVFLAHYKGEQNSEPVQNGFAGIFDLRGDLRSLAAAIRDDVAQLNGHTCTPLQASSQITPLGRFIEMERRISNPSAVLEIMLSGFLDLVGGHEGMLLVPRQIAAGTFSVAANLGEEVSAISTEVILDPPDMRSLLGNSVVRRPTGLLLRGIRPFHPPKIAVPLRHQGRLCAVLLADGIEQSEILSDYLGAASFVFQQLARREDNAERDRLLNVARQNGSVGWILADPRGRVILSEGLESTFLTNEQTVLRDSRLRDAVARAADGDKGEVIVRGRRVQYLPVEGYRGSYCQLVLRGASFSKQAETPSWEKLKIIADLLEVGGNVATDERMLWKDILQGKDTSEIFDLSKLKHLGISVQMPSMPVSSLTSRKLALLLIAWKCTIQLPFMANLFIRNCQWVLTLEVPEDVLKTKPSILSTRPILELTVQALDDVQLAEGGFGIQLSGTV